MPKSFLIPYIDEYIENFDREQKRLFTKNALLLLEAS
jgi:ribosomal 30S subunit maturation factor RimM